MSAARPLDAPVLDTPAVTPGGVLTRPLDRADGDRQPGAGEGLDRRRPRPRVTPRRAGWAAAGVALTALIAWAVLARTGGTEQRVALERLTVATVTTGPFQEFAAVTGTVHPLRTVLLDAVVGGQVARRLVNEGDTVRAGQPLFVLENDEMALQVMSNETQLEDQAASLRQNRLALDKTAVEGSQASLTVDREIAELDYDIDRLTRERDRTAGLVGRGASAPKDLDALASELAYAQRRRELAARGRELTRAAQAQDAVLRDAQLRDMGRSVGRLRENLALVRSSTSDLVVRAPVAGQFSALAAEVGELKVRGSRLGQIDVLDEALIRTGIDEHYLSRVAPGQQASAEIGGVTYRLRVRTVFPEVASGRFETELVFDSVAPSDLRRGQSLAVRIELGAAAPAVLLPRGPFLADTGGAWVWVVSADGRTAQRRPVTLGRQSPTAAEVLSGLEPGERVVTSGYDTFGDAHRLTLTD